jgi:formate dehydrogenase subunit gamma
MATARTLLLGLACAVALAAQAQQQAQPQPPRQDEIPGIEGQNILNVKPETPQVRPDASSGPEYMKQNNAQRNQVQPGNNSPMWRDVQSGVAGFTSLPPSEAPEAGVLIQRPVQYPGSRFTTAGQAWREVRNNWIIPYGGALFLIVLGALAIFYFTRGPIGHNRNEGPPAIERFTPFERSAHWANAIAFVVLAISGLVMAFGRFFLLPVIGGTLFGGLTYLLKTLHNFAGPLFAVSLVIIFFTFVRDNRPQRGDLRWFASLFRRQEGEAPSHRFNAGEKLVFWGGVLVLGVIVVASGFVMDQLVPGIVYTRGTMQLAHMVHSVATVLMLCVFAGHIYVGTIGMRGAYSAMRNGYVDEGWAREHHAYWYDDVAAGRIPAQRSRPAGVPAEGEAVRPA